MADEASRTFEDRRKVERVEPRAERSSGQAEGLLAAPGESTSSALPANDPRLDSRMSAPIRATLVQRMQQTHGNQFVQRWLQPPPGTVQIQRQGGHTPAPSSTPTAPTAPASTPAPRWTSGDRRMISSAVSQVGIIEEYQASRVEPAVNALSEPDYTSFRDLLTRAGSNTQRAFLCKALAYGRSVADITTFANTIRPRSDRWVMRNLTVVNMQTQLNAQSRGIVQQYEMSCGPTSVQVVHASYDPIYALQLRSGGDVAAACPTAASNPASVTNPTMTSEQGSILTGQGGTTTDRTASGGTGAWVEPVLNAMSGSTGISYTNQIIGTGITLDNALTTLRTNLEQGVHVPITVGGSAGHTAHYVVVMRRAGNNFQIHDVGSGQTMWRSETAFRNNQLHIPNAAGWNFFTSIDVPTVAATPRRQRE